MAFRNATKPITTALTTVYQCPTAFEAVIHSLYISNTDTVNDISVDVKITTTKSSSGTNGSFYVLKNVIILSNTTLVLDKPLNLRSGDSIQVSATANTCECVASILTTAEDVSAGNL